MNLLTIRCSVIQTSLRGNAVSRKEEVENYRKDSGCSCKNVYTAEISFLRKSFFRKLFYFTQSLTVSFRVYNSAFEMNVFNIFLHFH